MVQIFHNKKENDYSVFCDNCNSEEICDHDFGRGNDLESIDYCADCCPKCEQIREFNQLVNQAEAIMESF